MSNFHDYDSKDWKPRSWRNHFGHRISFPTASLPSTLLWKATPTDTTLVATPEVTKSSNLYLRRCLQNCRDAFRISILPHDKDFDKICAVLANDIDDAVFNALYICDEGCGVVVNSSGGVGQDPNVNAIVARCQSLGFSAVVDPGPPQTTPLTTILPSPSLELVTSTEDRSSQFSSTLCPGTNLPTASVRPTSTLSDPSNSYFPTLFTTTLIASSGKPTVTFLLSSSTSTNSFTMFLTNKPLPLTSTFPSVLYSPTISPIPTSIISDHPSISKLSPFPSATQASSSPSPATSATSIPTSSPAMTPNNRVGLIIAILGLVALLSATIILLLVRQKQRTYFRSLIQQSREKEKEKDREKADLGEREAGLETSACCFDIPPPRNVFQSSGPYPSSSRYSLSISGKARPVFTRIPVSNQSPNPTSNPKGKRGDKSVPVVKAIGPSTRAETTHTPGTHLHPQPISPILQTPNGTPYTLHQPLPNTSLPIDAQGIRWPDLERVTLRTEAREFLEWSWEYERKQAERRVRVSNLERGRRFEFIGGGGDGGVGAGGIRVGD